MARLGTLGIGLRAALLACHRAKWHAVAMALAARTTMTEAAYLAWDRDHEGKREFVNGEMIAMAGAGEAHDRIVMNLALALGGRLRGSPCRIHSADMRVLIDETGLYAYPDLSVVCGPPDLTSTRPPSLKNPRLLVEVLSSSTEGWDRSAKLEHYRRRASVDTILFVDSRRRRVERYVRNTDGSWTLTDHGDGELALPSLGVSVRIDDLCEGVEDAWAREAAQADAQADAEGGAEGGVEA